ncbi:hypothetical protein [Maricaulis sp. MIT060901]
MGTRTDYSSAFNLGRPGLPGRSRMADFLSSASTQVDGPNG